MVCSSCKVDLSTDAFYADRTRATGLQRTCKACRRKLRRPEPPERRALRDEARRRAKGMAPRAEYVARVKAQACGPEEKRRRRNRASAAWQRRNRERVAAWTRERRRADPLANRAQVKAWASANPDAVVVKAQRRRASVRAVDDGTVTTASWRELRASYAGLCAYCGLRCDAVEMDHVDPVALGGFHTIDNVVPACQRCNRSKHARPLLVWLAIRGRAA